MNPNRVASPPGADAAVSRAGGETAVRSLRHKDQAPGTAATAGDPPA